jgi:uncharacterized membrane protein YbhN (UPF0104 family)
MKPTRQHLILFVVWALLAAGLGFAASSLAWGEVWAAAARATPWLVAMALLINFANAPLWGACWYCLMGGKLRWLKLTEVQSVVLTSVQAFSLLGGGAAAWVLATTRLGLSRSQALSLLMLDQLTTGLVKVLLIAAALLIVPASPLLHIAGAAMLVGMGGFLATLIVASKSRERILHYAERFSWLHHVAEWTQHIATVRSFRYMSGAVLFMLIRRVVEGTAGWLVAIACGIDVGPEFIAVVIASLAIVTIIPSPPGNVGLYEVAVVAAYQWLGVAPEPALAAALLQHAVLLIPALIPGALIALFVPGYARRDQR